MNPLVKKEIRLLLPGWSVAMLLALVQAITRPYDFYIASLLFFGLTIMALTTFGREASLNTFSSLLAQPAERLRIWQTKLTVLAAAFLMVFVVWLVSFGIALLNSSWVADGTENPYNLFITICLIATATFTGGLWTTLLLRQLASAFWLTLLVPAVLSGFSAVFLAQAGSDSLVIAVLSVVIAVYSVGGFLLARWLFFRAQDVGWSGGTIEPPEWKIFARSENAVSLRNRKPVFALVKKEFQLQQISLFGAAGLLVLHLGLIVLRKYHHFEKDSAGVVLAPIFWMLWLVMAPVIGSVAVAEERRLGVMEGQLCLPVSRRLQFAVKGTVTLLLGIFLGGVLPMLLEYLATSLGVQDSMFSKPADDSKMNFFWLAFLVVAAESWLTLIGFYSSTLSRSFLQAVGFGIATFFISSTLLIINGQAIFQGYGQGYGQSLFFEYMPVSSMLPIVIAVPTIIFTLLWLAYLNFKNFRPGWRLWRRNLVGFAGALGFIVLTSVALYNRVWEVFEPAEPPHGPAKLSLAKPPGLHLDNFDNLCVRLPDGRVWFDHLTLLGDDANPEAGRIKSLLRLIADPLPKIAGEQRLVAGSNWVSASVQRVDILMDYRESPSKTNNHIVGYLDTVGVRADGTLWISDASKTGAWTGQHMNRFGSETNWQQVVRARDAVLLLKHDGTLWCWGTRRFDWSQWQTNWPGLHGSQPYQIGTASDWKEIFNFKWINYARKSDGQVWEISFNDKTGKYVSRQETSLTNLEPGALQTLSLSGSGERARVLPDGTLWMSWQFDQNRTNRIYTDFVRVGTETNWSAVALTWCRMVALKADGSLWEWRFAREWNYNQEALYVAAKQQPIRLGKHNDWVAIDHTLLDVVALAADGSLWLWPDPRPYEESTLLKIPKPPRSLGNLFGKSD